MDIYDFNDFCLYNIPNTAFGHNFPLSWIDTSNITDMSDMFSGNFPNTSTPVFWDAIFYGIEKWDVSNVTNMKNMFNGAEYFNRNLKNWDVSNVTDMSGMFAGVSKLFTGEGLENWDVSNVTDMSNMFNGCIHFNKGLSNWDVSNVINMKQMFTGCHDFQGIGLQYWDVRKVENM
jgi:surface protein